MTVRFYLPDIRTQTPWNRFTCAKQFHLYEKARPKKWDVLF